MSGERWVRRCPEHKTRLVIDGDTFWCYSTKAGATPSPHEVLHPEVFDAWKRRVNNDGLPNDVTLPGGKGKGGRLRPRRSPPPPPPPEKGRKKMSKTINVAAMSDAPKTQTLDRAKYQGPDGEGLFLRLMRMSRKKGDPYQVKWTSAPNLKRLGQKGTVGGISHTGPTENVGRELFKAAKEWAEKMGWKPIESAPGSRLELRPIPAPKKPVGRPRKLRS